MFILWRLGQILAGPVTIPVWLLGVLVFLAMLGGAFICLALAAALTPGRDEKG